MNKFNEQNEAIRVYMRYHVSELDKLNPEDRSKWYEGQALYIERRSKA